MKKNNVVIFGPYVGEFGWELLYWQGWVRKVCESHFTNHKKIAISFEGRDVFYDKVDEFRELPQHLSSQILSSRNYICDYWHDGQPSSSSDYFWSAKAVLQQLRNGVRPHRISRELINNDIPSIRALLIEYQESLRAEFANYDSVEIYAPWHLNDFHGYSFGFDFNSGFDLGSPERVTRIEFNRQTLTRLSLENIVKDGKSESIESKRVAIYPRRRNIRRSDKNWSESNYTELIELFQAAGYEVGILGDRLGAYFTESAPAGVVDLINIEDVGRLRVQMEFLKKSNLAVGAMSGATLFSLATGTPTLIFGYAEEKSRYESENFLKTPLLYHSHMNPTPKELFELATNFLKNTIPVQLRV
jgi:hypothetical protein